MTTTLLGLHGFSLNGPLFRELLVELMPELPAGLILLCPDAPHACSVEATARVFAVTGGRETAPPHRCFWDATDDGREYRGWPESLHALRAVAAGAPRLGLFGFSQGAIAAAALCALAARGEFPEIAFAVLVAGRVPRSDLLASLFGSPLRVPSMHVWGERDAFAAAHSPVLADCFEPDQRQLVRWSGGHRVPTRGPAADAVAAFIAQHAA